MKYKETSFYIKQDLNRVFSGIIVPNTTVHPEDDLTLIKF